MALINLHDKMKMVRHQAICDEIKLAYLVSAIQGVEKGSAVIIVEEHVSSIHAAIRYVIEAGFRAYARSARHIPPFTKPMAIPWEGEM